MAKKDISSIEKGAGGCFLGFVTDFMNVAWQKAVPDGLSEQQKPIEQRPQGGHLYRDAPTNNNTLPANHYRVPVTYASIPSIDELKKEWGKDNVSFIFDGRPFSFHASCVGMDRAPCERTFYVHDAGGDWGSEERIAWGTTQRNAAAPNGYRPATHEETYEFAKAHPELVDFVGLGSFAVGDNRYVASVWQSDSRRILGYDWCISRWGRRARVLFVSK